MEVIEFAFVKSYIDRINEFIAVNNQDGTPQTLCFCGLTEPSLKASGTKDVCVDQLAQNTAHKYDIIVSKIDSNITVQHIDALLNRLKLYSYLIFGFNSDEVTGDTLKMCEKKLLTHLMPHDDHTEGVIIIKRHPTISVILNTYNRLDYLSEQIEAINKQTIKPTEIIIWNNSNQTISVKDPSIPTTAFNSTTNTGVWSRFFAAFNSSSEYVALFDDDTIPGCRWFENCLTCMQTKPGLYGATGYKFMYTDKYHENIRVGWLHGINGVEEVDIVGHAWFLKRDWLKYFVNEMPNTDQDYKICGEDIHLSYTLKKYGGINSFIPPQPASNSSNLDLSGSIKGSLYGTDSKAISQQDGMDNIFDKVFRRWVYQLGHPLVLYDQVISMDSIVGPFKYEWAKIYQLIKSSKSMAFMRFVDGEFSVIRGVPIGSQTQAAVIDGWQHHGGPSKLGSDLIAVAENHKDPNIFYAFATSDCIDQMREYYTMFKSSLYSIKNIAYANHFINSNYRLTQEFIHTDLCNGSFGPVILLCNEECKSLIDTQHKYWITETVYFPNDIVNWWETNRDNYLIQMNSLAQKYTDSLFAFCIGPLSKVLINHMYHTNKNNRYIDFGSALDGLLKNRVTREYQMPNEYYANHTDKLIRFCTDEKLNYVAHACDLTIS
jgi:hypothetical protein